MKRKTKHGVRSIDAQHKQTSQFLILKQKHLSWNVVFNNFVSHSSTQKTAIFYCNNQHAFEVLTRRNVVSYRSRMMTGFPLLKQLAPSKNVESKRWLFSRWINWLQFLSHFRDVFRLHVEVIAFVYISKIKKRCLRYVLVSSSSIGS